MKTLEKLCKKFLTIHSRTVKIVLAFLLLGLTTTVHANEFRHWNEWTNKEKISYTTYNTLMYIDLNQTKTALKDPCDCYKEANPLFGKDPHIDSIILFNVFASSYLYWYVGSREEDSGNKIMWGLSALRVGVIFHNHQVGISWRVAF